MQYRNTLTHTNQDLTCNGPNNSNRIPKDVSSISWFLKQLIFKSCSKRIILFQMQDGSLEETDIMEL